MKKKNELSVSKVIAVATLALLCGLIVGLSIAENEYYEGYTHATMYQMQKQACDEIRNEKQFWHIDNTLSDKGFPKQVSCIGYDGVALQLREEAVR